MFSLLLMFSSISFSISLFVQPNSEKVNINVKLNNFFIITQVELLNEWFTLQRLFMLCFF